MSPGGLHKHFTCVNYGRSKIDQPVLNRLHWSMHAVTGAAYPAATVNYSCKKI